MRLQKFWQRVTDGLEVSQLWSQFESEARTSYRLYSKDVAAKTPDGLTDHFSTTTNSSGKTLVAYVNAYLGKGVLDGKYSLRASLSRYSPSRR